MRVALVLAVAACVAVTVVSVSGQVADPYKEDCAAACAATSVEACDTQCRGGAACFTSCRAKHEACVRKCSDFKAFVEHSPRRMDGRYANGYVLDGVYKETGITHVSSSGDLGSVGSGNMSVFCGKGCCCPITDVEVTETADMSAPWVKGLRTVTVYAAYGAHPEDNEACGSIYPGRLSREVGCVHHKTGLGPYGGKTCVVTRESDSQRPPRTSLVFSSTGNEGPAVAAVSYFGSAANDRAVGRRHLDGSSLRLLSKIMALAVDVVGSDVSREALPGAVLQAIVATLQTRGFEQDRGAAVDEFGEVAVELLTYFFMKEPNSLRGIACEWCGAVLSEEASGEMYGVTRDLCRAWKSTALNCVPRGEVLPSLVWLGREPGTNTSKPMLRLQRQSVVSGQMSCLNKIPCVSGLCDTIRSSGKVRVPSGQLKECAEPATVSALLSSPHGAVGPLVREGGLGLRASSVYDRWACLSHPNCTKTECFRRNAFTAMYEKWGSNEQLQLLASGSSK